MNQHLFLYVGLVPLLGILGQWLAWRLKVPAILFLPGPGPVGKC
jgi:hypothetical protein